MKKFTLGEMLDSDFKEPPCLIESLLWEKDNIILLGASKASKSVLAQQMAFSLSSGGYFLDQYKVTRPCKVAYFQAEGKDYETISRCKRMAQEVGHNRDNLMWFYVPGIALDKPDVTIPKIQAALGDFKPEVIFLDPLYKMKAAGSLKDDDVAGIITTTIDVLREQYGCAVIILHHEHRTKYDPQFGKVIEENSDAIFGSFVWQAWPDHILLLQKCPKKGKNARKLSCATQRSGDVIENLDLILIEPTPLLFEVVEDTESSRQKIVMCLAVNGRMHYKDIAKRCELAISTTQRALRKLYNGNLVNRDTDGFYSVKGGK